MYSPITPQQEAALVEAIRKAELATSGEIRVHLEEECPTPEPMDRAAHVFGQLGMHRTAQRNGVLFYVAWASRQFAVIGDAGINAAVPDDFWERTKEVVLSYFRRQQYVQGLEQGIQLAGEQLRHYFPHNAATDQNELDNSISFGGPPKPPRS
ncbi:TPM domain-containing protein [Hymenobacter latericus]|uniref:TPM domain-containing protein n=1 Tax=Hymenobacter sp. YIM 151858-1 TaxID=2987688 RepID=UPI0022264EFE|nr:TPM domain-containing protein [Hymenobacter sp. YIM 151858-1]UYZ58604.1 TPM domain-containing protein [Hymenobacter sp. YIM 151858-1]